MKELSVIQTLAELLMKNVDEIPLTDLYLAFPVLKSKNCPKCFPELIKCHIISNKDKVKELVNSAVYSIDALLLLGEDKHSSLMQETITWIKQQQLDDGGWHWRPKHELSKETESEVWITLATYDLLKRVGEDQAYLKNIRNSLHRNLEKPPKEAKGWSQLAYVRTASYVLKDPNFEPSIQGKAREYLPKAIEELKSQQLPNGGWAGSAKTRQGGIFQTVMVLDTLVEAGLGFKDYSVEKGFIFITRRKDKLLHARWGGVLGQALSIFADTLLKLRLIQ